MQESTTHRKKEKREKHTADDEVPGSQPDYCTKETTVGRASLFPSLLLSRELTSHICHATTSCFDVSFRFFISHVHLLFKSIFSRKIFAQNMHHLCFHFAILYENSASNMSEQQFQSICIACIAVVSCQSHLQTSGEISELLRVFFLSSSSFFLQFLYSKARFNQRVQNKLDS